MKICPCASRCIANFAIKIMMHLLYVFQTGTAVPPPVTATLTAAPTPASNPTATLPTTTAEPTPTLPPSTTNSPPAAGSRSIGMHSVVAYVKHNVYIIVLLFFRSLYSKSVSKSLRMQNQCSGRRLLWMYYWLQIQFTGTMWTNRSVLFLLNFRSCHDILRFPSTKHLFYWELKVYLPRKSTTSNVCHSSTVWTIPLSATKVRLLKVPIQEQ